MTKHLRKGEKFGWLGGWSGMFLWVMVIAIIRLAQGFLIDGAIELCLFAAGMISGVVFVPRRYETTRYWKLMTPGSFLSFSAVYYWWKAVGG